jgi:phage replication-related protein YjqB (UPF0714/DUF867 family)
MADTYKTFDALKRGEKGRSFRIRSRRGTATAIIAPHGGGIEAGTSEIADRIAGDDLSFYAFEGRKGSANRKLHITSTHFDEPVCCELLTHSASVVCIHGEGSLQKIVFLGGSDIEAGHQIRRALEAAEFVVRTHRNRLLQGTDRRNVCNRGITGRGVQLELSKGLRRSFFAGLSQTGRRKTTKHFAEFVKAIRTALTDRGGPDEDVSARSSAGDGQRP